MKRLNILVLLISFSLFSSCNAFLKEEPESFLTTETDNVDKKFVEAQLQGAYKAFLWYKNGRQGFIGISGTDEARGKTVEVNYWSEQGAIDKYNTSLNSDNKWPRWMWDTGYFGINRCNNTIVSSRKDIPGATEEWKRSIESEARFLRAANYFMLTQFFGKVPLITEETKPSAKPSYPREEIQKIYQYIIEDLEYAEQNLRTDYRAGKATIGAAKAMLMKVYMYASIESGYRNIEEAKKLFEEIEALNVYSLQSEYADLFDPEFENGTESVYEFQFEYPDEPNTFQKSCGSRAIGSIGEGGGFGIFLPSDYYLQSFDDPNDKRFKVSVRTEFYGTDGNQITSAADPEYIQPHCKKYEDPRNNNCDNSAKNIYYIRYADLILLYAECLNELGNPQGAVEQVNRIRKRAGAYPIETMPKDKLLDFIYLERMRELGMEGWRRFDLIRRSIDYFVKQVDTHNLFAKDNVKPYHALYPIPNNEINMNEGIAPEDQNKGYH